MALIFGDPKAAAPLSLSFSDAQATKGSGRWISDREWAFKFENDLPLGFYCTLQVRSGCKTASCAIFTRTSSYNFNSVGSFVKGLRPSTQERIDEEQYFLRHLNGSATLKSIQDNMWSSVEGLGERVLVELIDGKDRDALLKTQGLENAALAESLKFVTLTCNRRLKPASKMQLVYGKGSAHPAV